MKTLVERLTSISEEKIDDLQITGRWNGQDLELEIVRTKGGPDRELHTIADAFRDARSVRVKKVEGGGMGMDLVLRPS